MILGLLSLAGLLHAEVQQQFPGKGKGKRGRRGGDGDVGSWDDGVGGRRGRGGGRRGRGRYARDDDDDEGADNYEGTSLESGEEFDAFKTGFGNIMSHGPLKDIVEVFGMGRQAIDDGKEILSNAVDSAADRIHDQAEGIAKDSKDKVAEKAPELEKLEEVASEEKLGFWQGIASAITEFFQNLGRMMAGFFRGIADSLKELATGKKSVVDVLIPGEKPLEVATNAAKEVDYPMPKEQPLKETARSKKQIRDLPSDETLSPVDAPKGLQGLFPGTRHAIGTAAEVIAEAMNKVRKRIRGDIEANIADAQNDGPRKGKEDKEEEPGPVDFIQTSSQSFLGKPSQQVNFDIKSNVQRADIRRHA